MNLVQLVTPLSFISLKGAHNKKMSEKKSNKNIKTKK
jgi:hypothetical protein